MQHGSVIQTSRKEGPDVWRFRWSEEDGNGRSVYRKRVIGAVNEYCDPDAVRNAAAGRAGSQNNPSPAKPAGTKLRV